MMIQSSIKQLKLSTGEEVICDVLDEQVDSIAVRNCLTLEDRMGSDGQRYFVFRSLMTYQDSPLDVILLMNSKVVALCTPSKDMLQQYAIAVDSMNSYSTVTDDDLQDDMTDEEWFNHMENYSLSDSDTSGLVKH